MPTLVSEQIPTLRQEEKAVYQRAMRACAPNRWFFDRKIADKLVCLQRLEGGLSLMNGAVSVWLAALFVDMVGPETAEKSPL